MKLVHAKWRKIYSTTSTREIGCIRHPTFRFQETNDPCWETSSAVSVHCVNQHRVIYARIKELISTVADDDNSNNNNISVSSHRRRLPTTIAMHSFTGTAHHAKQLLELEKEFSRDQPVFSFGFSHTVNYAMCTSIKAIQKGKEAICAIPFDRLLAESDVHSSKDLIGGTAGAMAYISWARNASIEDIAQETSRNGLAFVRTGVDTE